MSPTEREIQLELAIRDFLLANEFALKGGGGIPWIAMAGWLQRLQRLGIVHQPFAERLTK